jgi:hypothetical protein
MCGLAITSFSIGKSTKWIRPALAKVGARAIRASMAHAKAVQVREAILIAVQTMQSRLELERSHAMFRGHTRFRSRRPSHSIFTVSVRLLRRTLQEGG